MAEEISGHAVISAKYLYDLVHSGPGTWTMDRAHDAAKAHSKTQQEINEEITAIANDLQQAWRGQAAEGAHGATQPLRDGATISAEALHNAQNVHAHQGQHFSTIHRDMDPVAEDPPQTGVWDSITPWDTDTEQAVQQYNNASNRNVELYNAYSKTTDSSVSEMPQRYGAFPQFDGEFSVADKSGWLPTGPAGGSTNVASFEAPSAPSNAAGHATPAGGPNSPPPQLANQPNQPTTGSGPVTGANQGNTPTPNTPGTSGPTGTPRPGPAPGIAPIPAAGNTGGDTVRSTRGSISSRFGPSSSRFGPGTGSPSSSRFGPTGGRFGPSAPGEGAARGGAPGRAGMPGEPASPGGRTGATPGAAAAAEAAAARGAGGGARPGAAGAPIAPAGKGKSGEDEEHQRKTVLEEPDAEGLFGTDQSTAPPVIGETRRPQA